MAGNAGSLYLEISVDDKGSIKVRDFSKEVEKAASSSSSSFDQVDRSAKRLDGSLDSLRSTAGTLAAAFGAYKVGSFIKETAVAAARYETLGAVLGNVGRNVGYSRDELEAYTNALEDGGIAMMESREILLKMMQAEMDLTKVQQLSRAAQNIAAQSFLNSSEAFTQMVYGIQSAQTDVLRTLGINVNFEQSYKKVAKSLGIASTALTEHQKIQARTVAVLEEVSKAARNYEVAMSTAGKKMTSFTRYVGNFQLHMGEAFEPATIEAVDKATAAMQRLTEEIDKPENQERLAGLAATAVDTAESLAKVGTAAAVFAGRVADGWNRLPETVQKVGLLGAVVLGPKGFAALAAASHMYDVILNIGDAIALVYEGRMSLSDFASMNADELDTYLKQLDTVQGVEQQLAELQAFRAELAAKKDNPYDGLEEELDRDIAALEKKLNLLKIIDAQQTAAENGEYNNVTDGWLLRDKGAPKGVVPDPDGTTTDADKVARAIDSITVKLAAMNDTGTDGEARISKLNKEYRDFAKVLGTGNPKVREFADVIAYASDHYGRTPAEVAKSTRAVEQNVAALEGEIAAVQQATDSYGHINKTKLAMSQAELEAERRYQAAVLDGVDPILAARRRELELEQAKATASKDNLEVLTEFHKEYLRLVKGESAMQMEAIAAQARVYLEAGADAVAVAQWEAQAKLKASREWRDGAIRGFQDYADAATDAATHAEELVSTSMQGMEDAIVQFVKTGKLEFADLVQTIEDELLRMSIQKGITGPLSDLAGSFLGSLWPNAHGGAYDSPSLARLEGKVVDRPTYFQFAHGGALGVAGEGRNKEVIAPLFRDPVTNDMGVKVHGAMGGGNTYYMTQNFSLPTPSADQDVNAAYLAEAAKAYRKEMKAVFSQELRQAVQPGGQLNGGPTV